jgi:hypothetical protein
MDETAASIRRCIKMKKMNNKTYNKATNMDRKYDKNKRTILNCHMKKLE